MANNGKVVKVGDAEATIACQVTGHVPGGLEYLVHINPLTGRNDTEKAAPECADIIARRFPRFGK